MQLGVKDSQIHARPVAIAPAPANVSSIEFGSGGDSVQLSTMQYTCQTCAKRKVKCDKIIPTCSSCRKGTLKCFYQAPLPRRRKRKLSGDIHEKLAQYEQILHQHGLLPENVEAPFPTEEELQEPLSFSWNQSETSTTGTLLGGEGRSRYMDSKLWHNLGADEMQQTYDDEKEEQIIATDLGHFVSDPLTGAFMGSQQCLLLYHPTSAEAIALWKIHVENVEPICKIIHVPSTFKMFELASKEPAMVSKANECLLFAIYHFAVFSTTEEECVNKFGQSKDTLMQKYHFASRQALVNASFLKTTEITIMQALILFLLPCRDSYDPHTYWILTGVAIRIAQRIGLHRDGQKLGLPPYEVQMRRRLFYQLIPLDGVASQMSGTGIGITPNTWDTQQPLNINDNQIWPGMVEMPQEQKGATEMIFCLARSCVGKLFARTGKSTNKDLDLVISDAESEIEEKYIRYCDILNPLHFLTMGLARAAITAMRLRIRLSKVRNKTITAVERRELLQFSQKIIDTGTTAYAHAGLKKYQWYMKPFFVWGSWDSLIFVLTSLRGSDLLSSAEVDAAWGRVEQIYVNHSELLESKRAVQIAIGRLALKAWDVNPSSNNTLEPDFIKRLRHQCDLGLTNRVDMLDSNTTPLRVDDLYDQILNEVGVDSNDFNLNDADWILWDQLNQDY